MSRLMLGLCILLLAAAANARECESSDVTGKKWLLYSSQADSLYCQFNVANDNKVSGFCRTRNDFDDGTKSKVKRGKLAVSKSCAVSGSFRVGVSEFAKSFGGEDSNLKILKSTLTASGDTIHGILTIDNESDEIFAFTAVLN